MADCDSAYISSILVLTPICLGSPTAETTSLSLVQCGFESHSKYQQFVSLYTKETMVKFDILFLTLNVASIRRKKNQKRNSVKCPYFSGWLTTPYKLYSVTLPADNQKMGKRCWLERKTVLLSVRTLRF